MMEDRGQRKVDSIFRGGTVQSNTSSSPLRRRRSTGERDEIQVQSVFLHSAAVIIVSKGAKVRGGFSGGKKEKCFYCNFFAKVFE